ncbi:MAG TPA: glycosyltransferase family 4 protein [Candidatus Dojkabacteria bacterium]|jgi:phosphatidylinositol alpha-mannosyltransferase
MKIGIVMDTTLNSNDGVQQYVKSLARELLKNGHQVKFLVGESKDEGEFKGRIVSLSKNFNFKSNANKVSTSIIPQRKKISKTLKAENFDILHVQMPYSPFMAGIVIEQFKGPIVATFHILPSNSRMAFLSAVMGRIQQKTIKKLARVFAVSEAARKFAKNYYKVESKVIPNMVDIEKFKKGKKISRFDDSKTNILFLGRLVERKGAMYAIKAFELLNNPNTRLIIAGDGYLKNSLKEYAENKALKNVVFEGYIPEDQKADYYKTGDICIFPATSGESFGIVLIEAMAAGKAVVVFDNPGYRSVMEGISPEFIAENKNINDLKQKLQLLIDDRDLMNRVSESNEKKVERFNSTRVAEEITKEYNRIIRNYSN